MSVSEGGVIMKFTICLCLECALGLCVSDYVLFLFGPCYDGLDYAEDGIFKLFD